MPSFCSDIARSHAGVGIHGSATVAPYWLCIEHPDPWAAREIKQGTLPESLVEAIGTWDDRVPGLRTQGIRREVRTWDRSGEITLMLASTETMDPEDAPVLWQGRFETYDDIAGLDVPRLVEAARRGEKEAIVAAGFEQATEPVILTCTNGKRDACCALKGRAFHEALADIAPRAAWQTTHLGGHRFAPTAVALPYGHQYGWLTPDDAAGLWAAALRKRIFRLDRYRGCTAFARPVQAAAIAVREQARQTAGLSDGRVWPIDVEQRGEDLWAVCLAHKNAHVNVLVRRTYGSPAPASCGADPKPAVRYEAKSVE